MKKIGRENHLNQLKNKKTLEIIFIKNDVFIHDSQGFQKNFFQENDQSIFPWKN
jgi:hypothetical protein